MEIKIITVGKIKEKYLNDGIAEYAKRLSRYCKLTFCQVPDEKTPDKASDALNEQIKNTEAERLMKHIREQDYVIALAIDGKMLDSVELSEKIGRLGVEGKSSVAFVIGGSLGLGNEVLKRADYKLSFSRMTFPHQLMQMILLEQIYRGYRIRDNRNEQMWNTVINTEFHYLRVNHDQFDIFRRCFVQDTYDQGIDTDRFTGTCSTRDQKMWHLGNIRNNRFSCNIFTNCKRQPGLCTLKFL